MHGFHISVLCLIDALSTFGLHIFEKEKLYVDSRPHDNDIKEKLIKNFKNKMYFCFSLIANKDHVANKQPIELLEENDKI